jgi:DNA-binding transcriptional ArsR family regulator
VFVERAGLTYREEDALARTTEKTRKPRSREAAVSYAVGHRIRIEILAVLHEGPASAKRLAREVRQPLSTVTHHIEELLADGSIEVARTRMVGNVEQNFYRVIRLPEYSSEEIAELSAEQQQATYSIVLQSMMAEALASLWAGTLLDDPLLTLAWNRIDLDEQARRDLAEEHDRSWRRIHEIAAEAANRRADGGDPGSTYVVASMGFLRSRTSAPALGRAGLD